MKNYSTRLNKIEQTAKPESIERQTCGIVFVWDGKTIDVHGRELPEGVNLQHLRVIRMNPAAL